MSTTPLPDLTISDDNKYIYRKYTYTPLVCYELMALGKRWGPECPAELIFTDYPDQVEKVKAIYAHVNDPILEYYWYSVTTRQNRHEEMNRRAVTTRKQVTPEWRGKLGEYCSIGNDGFEYHRTPDGQLYHIPHLGGVSIKRGVDLYDHVCVNRATFFWENTTIETNTKIDHHVHIAQNVHIGARNLINAGAIICDSAKTGDECVIGANVCIGENVVLGDRVRVCMGSVVLHDIADGMTVFAGKACTVEKSKHKQNTNDTDL